jgi:hypothetical protein
MTKGQKVSLGVLFALPTLCCLGGMALVVGTAGGSPRALEAELAKAREVGMPLDPEDMKREVPEEQNAAPLYRQAAKILEERGVRGSDIGREPEAFDKAREVLPIIEKATDLPYCWYDYDYRQGFLLEFPEAAQTRTFARIFSEHARRQSEKGDWKGALRSAERAQKVGRHLAQNPTLISMLVETATEAIAIRTIRDVVEHHAHRPEVRVAARQSLERFGPLPDLKNAIGGEVVMGRAGIHQLGSESISLSQLTGGERERAHPVERMVLGNRTVRNAVDRKFVEAYRYLWERTPDDPAAWAATREAAVQLEKIVEDDPAPAGVLNQILMPVLSGVPDAVGNLQTHRRLLLTWMSILDSRRTSGSFPEELPSLGDTSLDPFTGEPFRYRLMPQGFVLYSVGRDRVDNGGVPVGGSSRESDVIYQFPTPAL